MRHIPHVVVPRPWGNGLALSDGQRRHLSSVLRLVDGATVSYTDGEGTMGGGVLVGDRLQRGEEQRLPAPPELHVAVAPIRAKDRVRFMVEKLVEVGVTGIRWLETERGQVGPPADSRLAGWMTGAVEQSRRAWLPSVGTTTWADLERSPLRVVVLDAGGETGGAPTAPAIVVIGPEGGFDAGEIPTGLDRWSLGDGVLRTETAAIMAAGLVRFAR